MISIIVPIYNVEKYLRQCIDSILSQTYTNLEIILVDDGSKDKSGDICDYYKEKDARIKVIHKTNGGLSSARNAGLEIATGEYIGYVDSDDYIAPDMYECLLKALEQHPEAGVVSTGTLMFNDGKDNYKPMNEEWERDVDTFTKAEDYCIKNLSNKTHVVVWNKLYRQEVTKDIKFLEGRNNEDARYEFDLSKILIKKGLGFIETTGHGYYYRLRENSISSDTKKPVLIDTVLNLEDMIAETGPEEKKLLDFLQWKHIHYLMYLLDSIITKDKQREKYWDEYHAKLSRIPLETVKRTLNKAEIRTYLYLRFVPWYRRLRLKHQQKS